ncbi:MAG: hypothetical protein ABII27_05140 [bacterium]
MKNSNKSRNIKIIVGTCIGLTGAGGFINDFFIKSSYQLTENTFRLALAIPMFLCVLTFPWWKKPWKKYIGLNFNEFVGIHIFAYLVMILAIASFLGWLTSPKIYFYYFFSSIIYLGVSLYLYIQNYREK